MDDGFEKEEDKNKPHWLPMMQHYHQDKKAGLKSQLGEAMFINNISIDKEDAKFKYTKETMPLSKDFAKNTPRNFIPAAYKNILEADNQEEFESALNMVQEELKRLLIDVCFTIDPRAKTDKSRVKRYRPKVGLRILRAGLLDLYEDDTLKKNTDISQSVSETGEDHLASQADALYRLLGQGRFDSKQTGPNNLIPSIFKDKLIFNDDDQTVAIKGSGRELKAYVTR